MTLFNVGDTVRTIDDGGYHDLIRLVATITKIDSSGYLYFGSSGGWKAKRFAHAGSNSCSIPFKQGVLVTTEESNIYIPFEGIRCITKTHIDALYIGDTAEVLKLWKESDNAV